MCHLENKLVKICPKLRFYRRYVDDIFVLISADYLTDFLHLLSCFHPSVNFTFETERGEQFSFLDVAISRLVSNSVAESIITSVFRVYIYIYILATHRTEDEKHDQPDN